MITFRSSLIFLPLLILIMEIGYISLTLDKPSLSPDSFKNTKIEQFQLLLRTADLKPSPFTLRDFQNEVEFNLRNQNNQVVTVILSTKKNTLSQVTALQKILKIANISNQEIKFIDLSGNRPYATF